MTNPIVPLSATGKSHPGLIFRTAKQQIAQAKTVAEVKDIRDKAIAMAVYALQAKNNELKAEAEVSVRTLRARGPNSLPRSMTPADFSPTKARHG
jgi:hypothetical protein